MSARVLLSALLLALLASSPSARAEEPNDGSCGEAVTGGATVARAVPDFIGWFSDVADFAGDNFPIELPFKKKGEQNNKGGSTSTGAISAKASVKVTGQPKKGQPDCGQRKIEIETELEVSVGIKRKTGSFGGGVTGAAGTRTKYEATLSREQLEAIQQNKPGAALPNPFEPSTVKPGTTVVLRQENFKSLELEASYNILTGTAKDTHGNANVVSVQRLEGPNANKVRVLIGPEQLVKQEAALGVSLGPFEAKAGVDRTVTEGEVKSYEFDLSTPEGLAAYEQLLATGAAPAGTPSGTIVYTKMDATAKASIAAPGTKLEVDISKYEFERKVITAADGKKTEQVTMKNGDTYQTLTWQLDANGNRVGEPAIQIRFENLSPEGAADLATVTGGTITNPGKKKQTVTLDLSGEQWKVWRDQAQASQRDSVDNGGWASQFVYALANAQSAYEVTAALASMPGDVAANELEMMQWTRSGKAPPLPAKMRAVDQGTCAVG